MKFFTTLLVVTGLWASGAHAAHQYIQCAPNDGMSEDRAVIAIWKDFTRATLFLSSNLDTEDNSGIIPMAKISGDDTPEVHVLQGENSVATFNVVIPASVYWKKLDDFRLAGLWTLKDGGFRHFEDLRCYSRVYED